MLHVTLLQFHVLLAQLLRQFFEQHGDHFAYRNNIAPDNIGHSNSPKSNSACIRHNARGHYLSLRTARFLMLLLRQLFQPAGHHAGCPSHPNDHYYDAAGYGRDPNGPWPMQMTIEP